MGISEEVLCLAMTCTQYFLKYFLYDVRTYCVA